MHIDYKKSMEAMNNHSPHEGNEHISHGEIIFKFKTKEGHLKLLQKLGLLKGTKLWIADESTLTQLKNKSEELKKVKEACK